MRVHWLGLLLHHIWVTMKELTMAREHYQEPGTGCPIFRSVKDNLVLLLKEERSYYISKISCWNSLD